MRSIFLFLIVIVVFLLVMAVIRSRKERLFKQQVQNSDKGAEKMVNCEVCQTYLPESQAICEDGKCFCGQKHLQAFKERP